MLEQRAQRRLAAIFAADVVGYSRLMEVDEEDTLRRLQGVIHEVATPAMAEHNGRLVKTTGDGLLAEFHSVVDAVRCAMALQARQGERDAGVPAERRIRFRIGINLGDIMVDGSDIFGDGVNVAARLEGLADAGGILLSGTAYDQVKKQTGLGFEFLGEQRVKNIADPVRVYRVLTSGLAQRSRSAAMLARLRRFRLATAALVAGSLIAAVGGAVWYLYPRPESPSGPSTVAVLPLTNMNGDPALDYFAIGITENLIASLARSPQIRVIARTSSDRYKGKSVDIRQIGKELDARYVLEGSVQKGQNKMRIVVQLIDASDGSHVWAERYDHESSDALALQDDVIERIVAALVGTGGLIDKRQFEEAWGKDTGSLGEYDYSLRGQDALNRHEIERAIEVFSGGLQRYPDSSLLRVRLGYGYFQRAVEGLSEDRAVDFEKAYRLGREGLASPRATPIAIGIGHALMSELEINYTRNFEQALRERELALQVLGSDYVGRVGLSYVPLVAGKPEDTIEALQGLTPQWPIAEWGYAYLSWAHFAKEEYEKAVEAANRSPIPTPTYSLAFLAASQVELGRIDEASKTVKRILEAVPSASLAMFRELHYTRAPGVLDRELAALRKAGLPE
jgi:TolB-like protein/class 3 adenylate cyclase